MSSIESSFSEAGESDAGGNNGNFSDTGSLMTNPAYRIAPGAKKDSAAVVGGGAERALRSPRWAIQQAFFSSLTQTQNLSHVRSFDTSTEVFPNIVHILGTILCHNF